MRTSPAQDEDEDEDGDDDDDDDEDLNGAGPILLRHVSMSLSGIVLYCLQQKVVQ